MDADTAEKAKARRDRRILLVCMAIGVVLPALLFCVLQLRSTR
jgi:hypothetical protein